MTDAREDWRERVVTRRKLPVPEVPPLRPDDPDMRVMLAIPMERTVDQMALFGFWAIAMQGWPLARLEYTRNDIARCKFTEFLLSGDYTHLLMLDSDHVHPPDIVQRLARWFRAYPDEVQVCGGLNFRRGEPFDPCAFIDPGDGAFRRMADWGQPGAIEVEALGSGSIMIARTAFETLQAQALAGEPGKPWFGYDYAIDGWPGTDMWFSARCRQAGVTLWCDTTTTSPHIGRLLIDETTYRAWVAEHLEATEEGKGEDCVDPAAEPVAAQ